MPDPVRIYRATVREARAGMSWTTDPSTAAWFARSNKDNCRIRILYGVQAQGTPVVLEGLVARGRVLAYLLLDRGEAEIVVPTDAVRVERVLALDEAVAPRLMTEQTGTFRAQSVG